MRKNKKLLITAAVSAALLFGGISPILAAGTVSGGNINLNKASGENSSVSGGDFNVASGGSSSVSGGTYNTASRDWSSISGGRYNTASGQWSSVSGGESNMASGKYSSVSGGDSNQAIGSGSSITSGFSNTARGSNSSVSGGYNNTASGDYSSVFGGFGNIASSYKSSANGASSMAGQVDRTSGKGSTKPTSSDTESSGNIYGGSIPGAEFYVVNSSISGGESNTTNLQYLSIANDSENNASEEDSSVFGVNIPGITVVSGGAYNKASGYTASVFGGYSNIATGSQSVVLGGSDSIVQGQFSTGVAGGSSGANAENGLAAGYQSVVTVANGTALGYQSTANKNGTIAFGHDAGDVSGYTVTWQQRTDKDSDGNIIKNADNSTNDYTKDPTITEKKYTSAYYNRLVKIADGIDAHDAVTVEQLNNAVAGAGSSKSYTAGSDIDISSTNAISVKKDGLVISGNTDIVTGDTVYNAVKNMAVYDSDTKDRLSLAGTSGTTIANLKSGALTASSMEAVNGSQLYSLSQQISGFAKDIAANTSKLSELSNSVTSANTSATTSVTLANDLDASKADTSLSNLSVGGKSVISAAANEAIQNYFKNNAVVTTSANVAKTMLFRMPMRAPAPDALLDSKADISYVDKQLEGKANKEDLNKKADITYVDKGLSQKADISYVNKQLDAKADKTFVESGLKLKADKLYVDKQLTETNVKIDLKASSDASNIDVDKFTQKLDTGAIEANNKGLVSGSKVYDAVKDKADKGYVDALALGLNQEIAGTAQGLHNEIQQMGNSLNKNINKAAAGSNALSALHPMEYDPNDKMNFAVGYGHYKGANATAIGAYYYPNANTMLSVGTTIGNGSSSVNAGISMKLGKGSAYNGVSKAEMASAIGTLAKKDASKDAEIQALKQENQEIKKELSEMKAYIDSLKK